MLSIAVVVGKEEVEYQIDAKRTFTILLYAGEKITMSLKHASTGTVSDDMITRTKIASTHTFKKFESGKIKRYLS